MPHNGSYLISHVNPSVRIRLIKIRPFVIASTSSVALTPEADVPRRRDYDPGVPLNILQLRMVPPPRRRVSPDTSLAIVAKGPAPRATSEEMTNDPSGLFALE